MRQIHKTRMTHIVETNISEYRALREEQRTRLTMNSTILNVIVLVVGGELAAYVQMSIYDKIDLFYPLILLSPILTTPLILMYYDNQFMVYRIGRYFTAELYHRIRTLTGIGGFGWEEFHQHTSGQLVLVAFGRNIFYVLVTGTPIAIFILHQAGHLPLSEAWQLMGEFISPWQYWVIIIDILLLIAVISTWVHSGIIFRSIAKKRKG